MCNIWQCGITKTELSAAQFSKLFERPYFKEVIDASISGGEPALRNDINSVVKNIITKLPNLQHLWVNSNGTAPTRIENLFEDIYGFVKNEYLCLSIEGTKEANRKVRGIDSYDSAIKTLSKCKQEFPGLNIVLSMTVTPHNSNIENLHHVAYLADKHGCSYTFRFANTNDDFYKNGKTDLKVSEHDIEAIMEFSKKHKQNDEFLIAQYEFMNTGKIPVMDDCRAGHDFVFIRPDGTMTPCINSPRILTAPTIIPDLGKHEQCSCCTECCFYPMLTYKKSNYR
jgi:MoaA/NifB/PqqE/SkfB family radical SAM enzyme